MNEKQERINTCNSKKRYKDRTLAKKAVRTLIQVKENYVNLRIYKCPFCKGYHLTKKVNT